MNRRNKHLQRDEADVKGKQDKLDVYKKEFENQQSILHTKQTELDKRLEKLKYLIPFWRRGAEKETKVAILMTKAAERRESQTSDQLAKLQITYKDMNDENKRLDQRLGTQKSDIETFHEAMMRGLLDRFIPVREIPHGGLDDSRAMFGKILEVYDELLTHTAKIERKNKDLEALSGRYREERDTLREAQSQPKVLAPHSATIIEQTPASRIADRILNSPSRKRARLDLVEEVAADTAEKQDVVCPSRKDPKPQPSIYDDTDSDSGTQDAVTEPSADSEILRCSRGSLMALVNQADEYAHRKKLRFEVKGHKDPVALFKYFHTATNAKITAMDQEISQLQEKLSKSQIDTQLSDRSLSHLKKEYQYLVQQATPDKFVDQERPRKQVRFAVASEESHDQGQSCNEKQAEAVRDGFDGPPLSRPRVENSELDTVLKAIDHLSRTTQDRSTPEFTSYNEVVRDEDARLDALIHERPGLAKWTSLRHSGFDQFLANSTGQNALMSGGRQDSPLDDEMLDCDETSPTSSLVSNGVGNTVAGAQEDLEHDRRVQMQGPPAVPISNGINNTPAGAQGDLAQDRRGQARGFTPMNDLLASVPMNTGILRPSSNGDGRDGETLQTLSANGFASLRLRDVNNQSYVCHALPTRILSKLRQKIRFWDKGHFKTKWMSPTNGTVCVESRIAKRTTNWAHGNGYACLTCEENGRLCIEMERGGVIRILPNYKSKEIDKMSPMEEAFWGLR